MLRHDHRGIATIDCGICTPDSHLDCGCTRRHTRQALCETDVTLNGNRAKISGYNNRFATVTDLTTRLSAEWSWEGVEHVITHSEGRFTS